MVEDDGATLKFSFEPVADAHTRLLILGSLPGEASLSRAQYYAHARNQFWRLVETVIGAPLPAAYEARLEALLAHGVGLWDVVRQARRVGSLDSAIRDHRPNALMELVESLPALRAVAFNGGKASQLGRALLENRTGLPLLSLPSSSPAYTASLETKASAWSSLRAFLD